MADSSANLPRERAKALSYCQPQRGGGVKVLLRFPFSPEKGTKRGCPLGRVKIFSHFSLQALA